MLLGMAAIVVTLGIGTCSTNARIDDGFASGNQWIDDTNRRVDDTNQQGRRLSHQHQPPDRRTPERHPGKFGRCSSRP